MGDDLLSRIAIGLLEAANGLILLAGAEIGDAEANERIVLVGGTLLDSSLDEFDRVGIAALAPGVFAEFDERVAIGRGIGGGHGSGRLRGIRAGLAFGHGQQPRRAI